MSRKPKQPWLAADVIRMIHLREIEKMKWAEIDKIMKRPPGGSAMKYEALRRGVAPRGKPNESGGRILLLPQQQADLAARKEAENLRDLTGTFFNDPPPGFSALDRKRHQVTQ